MGCGRAQVTVGPTFQEVADAICVVASNYESTLAASSVLL